MEKVHAHTLLVITTIFLERQGDPGARFRPWKRYVGYPKILGAPGAGTAHFWGTQNKL